MNDTTKFSQEDMLKRKKEIRDNKKKKFNISSPDEYEFDGEPTIADEEYQNRYNNDLDFDENHMKHPSTDQRASN